MLQHHRFTSYCLAVLAGLLFSSDSEIGNADDRPTHSASKPSKWQPTDPKWSEMQALLGVSIGSKSVLSFAARYRLKRYAKFTSGGFSNSSEVPFSLLFENLRIHRIVVVVWRNPRNLWPNGPVYRQKLPYGVTPRDTAEVVIRRVGQPSHKPDRNFVHYEGLGLSFVFDRDTHTLREIDIGLPKKKPAKLRSK